MNKTIFCQNHKHLLSKLAATLGDSLPCNYTNKWAWAFEAYFFSPFSKRVDFIKILPPKHNLILGPLLNLILGPNSSKILQQISPKSQQIFLDIFTADFPIILESLSFLYFWLHWWASGTLSSCLNQPDP